jgi:hypothetical protein
MLCSPTWRVIRITFSHLELEGLSIELGIDLSI